MHTKVRTALAVAGITVAVILMFMQLGFIGMVRESATHIHNNLDFDVLLVSRNYTYFLSSGTFPRSRLYQAAELPFVESAKPFYAGSANWLNRERRIKPTIFVMGVDPSDQLFLAPKVRALSATLSRPDSFIIDGISGGPNKIYGLFKEGDVVEVNGRKLEVGGVYDMGIGMVELGAMIVSDQNFLRIFPGASLDNVCLGLVKLRPGVTPEEAVRELRRILPEDADVMTRDQFKQREQNIMVNETSSGMMFGSGAIVAFVVGMVILYQTLSTQIIKYLPEFATLKAIGYPNSFLTRVVLEQATFLCAVSFVPGLLIALVLYNGLRDVTKLPMSMPVARVVFVLVSVQLMAMVAGLLSARKVYKADPADVF